jgi:aspartate racemase
MSWESSAEYYKLINQGMKARLGGHNNAKSLMVTVNFAEIESLQHEAQWQALGERMRDAAQQLAAGGADLIVLCTNTMHKVAGAIEQAGDLPLLHIADPTAAAIKRRALTCVGLLGTRFTMEQDFYRRRLADRHGIEVLIPAQAQRDEVHRIIYEELCHGVVSPGSKQTYLAVIDALRGQGAEGIVLGCTEIMLLINQADTVLPVFDTTALHAQAALDMALA